jgi:hypothetical protein
MSFICSSSITGTAFDLCIVAIPLINVPVYLMLSRLSVEEAFDISDAIRLACSAPTRGTPEYVGNLLVLSLAIVETFNFRAITPFGFALDFFLGLKEFLV